MRTSLLAGLLLAPLACSATAIASTSAMVASTSHSPWMVSTGVTPAKVMQTDNVNLPGAMGLDELPRTSRVVIKMDVSRDGQPRNLHILRSADPLLDQSVLAAVEGFRFRPARLDDHTITDPVNLTVLVRR
ncbi:MAG TPA: TonB family protein [Terracidiphilus sp.]|nr:TonB family protein [Terracidiphilus sp.]